MHYRYLKNLLEHKTYLCDDLSKIPLTAKIFKNKKERRAWEASPDTDYAFYSMVEGNIPSIRINDNEENQVAAVWGFVADYDNAEVDWDTLEETLKAKCDIMPTWWTKTPSGWLRLIWEFEGRQIMDHLMYPPFIKKLGDKLRVKRLHGGFDKSSFNASQYFNLGTGYKKIGERIPKKVYRNILLKTAMENPPQSLSTLTIPLEAVEEEVRTNPKFKGRWGPAFEIGSRGPLFWVDDGIDREGCQVCADGMLCWSDRGTKVFLSWREILGARFVEQYEEKKLELLTEHYWYTGKIYYKLINGKPASIDIAQLKMELKRAGFTSRRRGPLTELENALLTIQNDSRIDEIAPIIFDKRLVVESGPNKILNNSTLRAMQPASDGSKENWPFINKWLNQLFKNEESLTYFYAWLQRIYYAVLNREPMQGHALLLVGATNKGKSLLSNRLIGGLLGGFADASDYLSGDSKFNKELGKVAAWVIDDTTSSASFQEQRKATELIKKCTANPRIEYQAKYEDTITISWAGRVIMSLNMDPTSLSVIPTMDSSNRDKILALRISDEATSDFESLLDVDKVTNTIIEDTIRGELPYFGQWLLEIFKIPKEIIGDSRYGIRAFVDPEIEEVSFANSTRAILIETIEFFVQKYREFSMSENKQWSGTLTDFLVQLQDLNGGKQLNNLTANTEFMRRSMQSLEESNKIGRGIRPVTSTYRNNAKVYYIDLDPKWDISNAADND